MQTLHPYIPTDDGSASITPPRHHRQPSRITLNHEE
jgi:hypothetical protein